MHLARSERLKAILSAPRTEEAGIPSTNSSQSCPRLYSRHLAKMMPSIAITSFPGTILRFSLI